MSVLLEQAVAAESSHRTKKNHPDPVMRAHLFAEVAFAVRRRLLDANDAELIANWFDRLAVGEDPRSVFPIPRGRPKGKTESRASMFSARIKEQARDRVRLLEQTERMARTGLVNGRPIDADRGEAIDAALDGLSLLDARLADLRRCDREPDDIDVAYLVQQAISIHRLKRPEAEDRVARALGVPEGTVRNIYGRLMHEVETLPQFAQK